MKSLAKSKFIEIGKNPIKSICYCYNENSFLKTISGQLHNVRQGGVLNYTAILVAIGSFLIMAALFALLVHEQGRELGLFKAMGARSSFIFCLVAGEAALLGLGGAIAGLLAACLYMLAAGPGPGSLGPFAWFFPQIFGICVLGLFVCMAAGLIPACVAASREPYAAIRKGD